MIGLRASTMVVSSPELDKKHRLTQTLPNATCQILPNINSSHSAPSKMLSCLSREWFANQDLADHDRTGHIASKLAATGHAGPRLDIYAAPTASGLRFFGVTFSIFSAVNRPQRGRQSHRPTCVPAA